LPVAVPVVNLFALDGTTLRVDLTEASGAATAIWATADPGEEPTYTIAGGWTGTVYETGSFDVVDDDTDTISLTETTPAGTRELTMYFRDATGNMSPPQRVSVSVTHA
jgi:hypothetical protein